MYGLHIQEPAWSQECCKYVIGQNRFKKTCRGPCRNTSSDPNPYLISIIITTPLLVLNYFLGLKAAYVAFLMVGFIPLVYRVIKQKTGLKS